MEQRQIQLASGVELISVCTDQFKTGLFTVTLTVPLCKEHATANALIADVLYRGSRKHPDIVSLSAATDDLYGAALEIGIRQRGESQCICARCSFIDDIYALNGMEVMEPAIELVGEVLLDPAVEDGVFRSDYVSSEGANLADRIEARINDKTGWAVFRLLEEMCCGEAFALDKLGDGTEARSLTAQALWTRYQALLSEAEIVFYYNGSAKPQDVEAVVRRVFQPLLTERDASIGCEVRPYPSGAVRRVEDVLDVTQGKLVMGFRTGGITAEDSRYPALLVFNTLFGGSGTSKLFTIVREKLGLCYFATSVIDKLKGVMIVMSGVDFEDFDAAEREILKQLDGIKKGRFSKKELDAAIRSVVSALISRRDSQGQMEDDAVAGIIGMGEVPDMDQLIFAVEQVTAQQVAETAEQIQLDTVYRLTGREDA